MEHNYFVKKRYKTNPKYNYNSINSDSGYWTKPRIKQSLYNNYYVYDHVKSLVIKHKINEVLDIGCGIAVKLNHLIEPFVKNIYGLDSLNSIKICKKKYPQYNLACIDFEEYNPAQLPFEKKFNLIICSDIIEHLEYPECLLNLIKHYSHSETLIIVSTPERDHTRGVNNTNSPNKFHVREWNKNEFTKFVLHEKFKIVEHKLIPPIKPNFSLFYILQAAYTLISLRKFVFTGTQILTLRVNI